MFHCAKNKVEIPGPDYIWVALQIARVTIGVMGQREKNASIWFGHRIRESNRERDGISASFLEVREKWTKFPFLLFFPLPTFNSICSPSQIGLSVSFLSGRR